MKLFTCSIFPYLTKIWYDYTNKIIPLDEFQLTIYDCSKNLNPKDFPKATIKKHPNHEHGKKIDHFLKKNKSSLVFISDDDAFLTSVNQLYEIKNKFSLNSKLAIYSMHQRHFWSYCINEELVKPIGTYAFAVNPSIILSNNLSLKSKPTSLDWVNTGKGYWDTANFAQYELLSRNYQVESVNSTLDNSLPTLFGTSSGFLALFRKSFFSKTYIRKHSAVDLKELIIKDEYLFARAFTVAKVLNLYQQLYPKAPHLSLSLTINELEEIQKKVYADKAYIVERPTSITKMILNHLG